MSIPAAYARALFELSEADPKEGGAYVRNLRAVLARRGHEKLMPQVFAEYQKLELARERSRMHASITPERERTRTLLELYRTLLAA